MNEALQILQDALGSHSWVVAGVAFVLFALPMLLKAFGKTVPFLDPLLEVALVILKKFAKKEPAPPADPSKPEGAAQIVDVQKDDK